jgi:cobalt/nickel transport system permease protein
MSTLESGLYRLGWLDEFSGRDTPVHHVDPRAKVLATVVFLVCVVSMGKYDLLALLPFVIFPIVLMTDSGMPSRELGARLAIAAPFALVVGVFNPFFDQTVLGTIGPITVTGGWVSYASIMLRFLLTTSAALMLIATTGMTGVCAGIERLGVPDVLSTQLLFLYRYIFVLAEEVMRLARARSLRSFDNRGMGVKVYGSILGHLLLRSVARAQRVFDAMQCRGFDGHVRTRSALRMAGSDWMFLLGWSALFVVFRFVNVPLLVGGLVSKVIS